MLFFFTLWSFSNAYLFASLIQFSFWILQVVSFWRLFEKAGVPGWKSIIPFYSDYMLFKIAWQTVYFWILLLLSAIINILQFFTNNGYVTGVGASIITIIAMVISVGTLFIQFMYTRNLARAYGKSSGFGIGLFFLYPIFILILGLGSSRYIGRQHS